MNGDSFLDTNILVYSIEKNGVAPEKSKIAVALTEKDNWVLSVQVLGGVLGEFYRASTNARRKDRLTHAEAVTWIRVWQKRSVRDLTPRLVDLALEYVARFQISYYDALILAAAKAAGCAWLYTEDLNHGQDYDGVRVINPFAAVPHKK